MAGRRGHARINSPFVNLFACHSRAASLAENTRRPVAALVPDTLMPAILTVNLDRTFIISHFFYSLVCVFLLDIAFVVAYNLVCKRQIP